MRFPKNLVPLKRFPPPPLAERLPGNPVLPGSRERSAERRQGNRRRVRRPKRARASAAGAGACPRCGAGGRAGPGCGRYTVRSEGGVRNGRRPFGRGGGMTRRKRRPSGREGASPSFFGEDFRAAKGGMLHPALAGVPPWAAAALSRTASGAPDRKQADRGGTGTRPTAGYGGECGPGAAGGGSGRETIETLI